MKYEITNQHIHLIEPEHLVSGSQDIYTAFFEFDETWEEYDRQAVFKNGETEITVFLLDGESCQIPWEVLEKPGYLITGIKGEHGEQVRPTIYAAPYYIDEGVVSGASGTEPTPSIWEQIVERTAPAGGETGQVLTKQSDTNYDYDWEDPTSGGTTDYTELENKPQIEGITLSGNRTAEDLGLAKATDIPDVSQFITRAVNDLVNYYTKAQTDAAIAAAVGQITEIEFVVVQTLPQTGENGKIYLVPKSSPEAQNIKDEYIYVSAAWEKIGETTIDLSGYYTKTQTDALLADKADASDLTTHTADTTKHITAQERTSWNNKADATDLTAHTGDTVRHITAAERAAWNETAEDLSDHTEDTTAHITAQERTSWNTKASQTDLTAHTGDTTAHTTAAEKAAWNAKLDASAISDMASRTWVGQQGYLTQHQDISGKENTSNKVVALSAQSTDTQYPSAKCVYDIIGDVETLLAAL